MHDIEVSFTVRLNTALIQSWGLPHWTDFFALNHDADVSTWPEVYHHIAMEYFAGGELSDYVIDQGGTQREITTPRLGDPDIGVDVKAPDVLEHRDGERPGNVAQVWATDTGRWPDETP
jgi:hypothetical protein